MTQGTDQMNHPYFTATNTQVDQDDLESPMQKRRRYTQDTDSVSVEVEDLRQEVERLQNENRSKEARMQELSGEVSRLQALMTQFQQAQQQATQPTKVEAVSSQG
jgi:DNA repair exonuclease SbcCD ATPase subunit